MQRNEVIGWALALAALAWCPLARGDDDAEPVPDDPPPMAEGFHYLLSNHQAEVDGQTYTMRYGLYLPPEIEQAKAGGEKLPMVVFLCGAGSRGMTESKLYREGPLSAMKRSEDFRKSVHYIVLHPQVPASGRWENQTMGNWVADVTRTTIERWPVDPDRVYLVGMSMGGEGVWHAALADPSLYAVVASVGGRQHAEPARVAEALKDKTVWICVGSGDRDFTTGSQAMADAFQAVDADVIHTVIPGRGHDIWGFYIPRPRFYEWLLMHRRGQPPPSGRADGDELLAWAMQPPEDPEYAAFAEDLQKQFSRFKKWWYIENCGKAADVGLQKSYLGERNVFVTHPLNRQIPCRIMYTAQLPKGRSTLHLEVGAEPQGRWQLVVNIDNAPRLQTEVPPKDAGDKVWHSFEVDLSDLAGREVFIEILDKTPKRSKNARAVWKRIDLISD